MTVRPSSQELADREAFLDCDEQAREWVAQHGTQALVDELAKAVEHGRRVKLGTANTLILLRHIKVLAARLQAAEQALREIAEQQPKTVDWLRANGIIFDGPLGTDPDNWEHVAFGIYSDLCETDSIARRALEGAAE